MATISGTTLDELLAGTAVDDVIIGGGGNDTLDGGTGNDLLIGGFGTDTYLFGLGYGQDTIASADGTNNAGDCIQLGAGITANSLIASRSGPNQFDLVLNIQGTSDSLTIQNFLMGPPSATIVLADGTTLTALNFESLPFTVTGTTGDDFLQAINMGYFDPVSGMWKPNDNIISGGAGNDTLIAGMGNDVLNGGTGNDVLYAGPGNDVLDGGAGNDTLMSGGGNDTFLFGIGGGQDTIVMQPWMNNTGNIIQLGAGITANSLIASRSGPNQFDLVLNIQGTSDSLTIQNFLMGPPSATIVLADGTTLTALNFESLPFTVTGTTGDDFLQAINMGYFDPVSGMWKPNDNIISGGAGNDTLIAGMGNDVLNGGTGNDVLYAGPGNDVLDGGAGNDTLMSGGGNDTFLFGIGGGQDTIVMQPWMNNTGNIIQLGAGITANSLIASRSGPNQFDLVLNIQGTSDSLTIQNFLMGPPSATIVLADGTTLTALNFESLPFTVTGTTGDDFLQAINMGYFDPVSGMWKPNDNIISGGAGNDTLIAGMGNDVLNGGTGNDVLYAGPGNDVLDGGAGNDTLMSGGGNDTFLFGIGGGQDTIVMQPWMNNTGNIIQLGAGITANSLIASRSGPNQFDLVLNIQGTSDSLTIQNFLMGPPSATIVLADGTTLTALNFESLPFTVTGTTGDDFLQAINMGYFDPVSGMWKPNDNIISGGAGNDVLVGGAGNDSLNGGTGNDTLDGGAGNDTLVGGGGSDTFLFGIGSGQDTIQYNSSYSSTVLVGAGVSASGVTVSRVTNSPNDLILTINGTSDSLTFRNFFDTQPAKVIQFADGTTWNTSTLMGLPMVLQGSNGSDMFGAPNLDYYDAAGTWHPVAAIVDGLAGNDYLYGAWGNDMLHGGAGNDTVFGGYGNDVLDGGDGNDSLTEWAGNNLLSGGQGADTLTGCAGNDFLAGGTGNDSITTGGGADIIAFNRGDGQDILNGGVAGNNTISLGGGIQYSDLALSKVGNDLVLEVGGNEQITLANWYDTSANHKSVLDLQVVAEAMASFNPASTDPLLNKAIQEFDFTAIVNSFDQSGASSHWNVMNTLLSAHLSASDSAALGGDLAQQYGMAGTFTGMNLAAAQTVINDPQFGTQAQALHPLQGLQGGPTTL